MVGGNGGSELGSVEAGADMGRVYRKKEEGEREITYISNDVPGTAGPAGPSPFLPHHIPHCMSITNWYVI